MYMNVNEKLNVTLIQGYLGSIQLFCSTFTSDSQKPVSQRPRISDFGTPTYTESVVVFQPFSKQFGVFSPGRHKDTLLMGLVLHFVKIMGSFRGGMRRSVIVGCL